MIAFSKLPGALLRHGYPTTTSHDYYLSNFYASLNTHSFGPTNAPRRGTASFGVRQPRTAAAPFVTIRSGTSSGTALHARPWSAAQTCDLSHIHRCRVSPGKGGLEERLVPTSSTSHLRFRCCLALLATPETLWLRCQALLTCAISSFWASNRDYNPLAATAALVSDSTRVTSYFLFKHAPVRVDGTCISSRCNYDRFLFTFVPFMH